MFHRPPVLFANVQQAQNSFISQEKNTCQILRETLTFSSPEPMIAKLCSWCTKPVCSRWTHLINAKPTAMMECGNLNFFSTSLPKGYTTSLVQVMAQWESLNSTAQSKQRNTCDSGFASMLASAWCMHITLCKQNPQTFKGVLIQSNSEYRTLKNHVHCN